MTFRSILYPDPADRVADGMPAAPDYFADLNLDQVVAAVTARKEEYDLKPFFHMPLRDADAIAWRHEILRDLEKDSLFEEICFFAQAMRAVREHLARSRKLYYGLQRERWFLDAAGTYCDAVTRLVHELSVAELASRGLSAFRDYASRYASSERFSSLLGQTKELAAALDAIRYTVHIDGPRVEVHPYDGEADLGAEVEATFRRFQRGSVNEYAFRFSDDAEMNHVEAKILELVARSQPETFASLGRFSAANQDFRDEAIVAFDREIQFYVAYLEYIAPLRDAGLTFCYPRVTRESKEVCNDDGFDLALAARLVADGKEVVCNDFHLKDPERIIVVSGPNQGGKTTFARAFGQLHYLARLGCPVPGSRAQLLLFDRLFTHFEREEAVGNLRGKLQDELFRIHGILERATPDSVVILNEMFTATTLQDAVALSRKIAGRILALDALCVWVTFVDELASLGERTVSMVSTVVPENPAVRTYKILRRPADGLAYAMSIAEKHRLTDAAIKERLLP